MTDKFLESIGLPPSIPTLDLTPIEVKPTDLETDFEDSRRNLITVMAITKAAIDNLAAMANQSQDPEFYTALNGLINSFTRQQGQLLALYRAKAAKSKKEETASIKMEAGSQAVVFQGSTSDLSKALSEFKNK